MRTVLMSVSLAASLALAACARAPSSPFQSTDTASQDNAGVYDFSWSRDRLWDDGQAEVSLYEARRPQYGKIENYEALFIVVKEDFNPQLHVKADPPFSGKSLLPVLKLNAIHQYWTPNYPYSFLLSLFVRQDSPATLVKLTLGSQEWCGNTFKEVKTWGRRPELIYHTYWDGEADGSRELDLGPGDLLEDQFPLALRSLKFAPGLKFERRILPSLISNRLHDPPEPVMATVSVVGQEEIKTGVGTLAAWRVNVQMGALQQSWWFQSAPPQALLKMESSDGRAWLLKSRTRQRYWQVPTYHPEMQRAPSG
jgi:hypothetical protein